MQVAVEGHGIALARTSLLGNDVRNGLLVRLFDVELPSGRAYYFVYPPRLASSPKIVAFEKWLRAEAARRDDLVSPAGKPKPRR